MPNRGPTDISRETCTQDLPNGTNECAFKGFFLKGPSLALVNQLMFPSHRTRLETLKKKGSWGHWFKGTRGDPEGSQAGPGLHMC